LIGVFVTSLYSFRVYFMVFHGKPRFDQSQAPSESHKVVTVPLVLLAIPSVVVGACFVTPILCGDFFDGVIAVLPEHPAMGQLASQWMGALGYALHGFVTLPFWL